MPLQQQVCLCVCVLVCLYAYVPVWWCGLLVDGADEEFTPPPSRAYLSVLLSALQSSSGDHLTLVALCFFYALELSQGVCVVFRARVKSLLCMCATFKNVCLPAGMQLVHQLTSQDSQVLFHLSLLHSFVTHSLFTN